MDRDAEGLALEGALARLARDPSRQDRERAAVGLGQLPARLAPAVPRALTAVTSPDLGRPGETDQPLERFRRTAADQDQERFSGGLDCVEHFPHARVRKSGLTPLPEGRERPVVIENERPGG